MGGERVDCRLAEGKQRARTDEWANGDRRVAESCRMNRGEGGDGMY